MGRRFRKGSFDSRSVLWYICGVRYIESFDQKTSRLVIVSTMKNKSEKIKNGKLRRLFLGDML